MEEGMFQGMSYRSTGIDAGKVTLLLIHGLSGSLSAWFPYEKTFSRDFNLISVDIRGHGLSAHPKEFEAYAPEASAEDIYALLMHLGVQRSVVISHSFGTIVALELLRAHPAIATGAIFISPVYGFHRRRISRIAGFASSLLAGVLSPFHSRVEGSRTEYSKYTPASDWDLRRIVADVRHTGVRSYFFSFKHIAKTDRDSQWHTLSLPLLIIHGTKDSYVPVEFAKELATRAPHAQLHLIEGGNHILPLNNIAEIETCVREFASRKSV